jgi:hypothetical protein
VYVPKDFIASVGVRESFGVLLRLYIQPMRMVHGTHCTMRHTRWSSVLSTRDTARMRFIFFSLSFSTHGISSFKMILQR